MTNEILISEKEIIERKKRRYVRRLVHQAIARGELHRPQVCDCCAKNSRQIQAHHRDYGQPLAVDWLCSECHLDVHMPDHPLNPLNNQQTPLPHIVQEYNRVCVMFELPIANFIALKRVAETRNLKISQLLREMVIKTYPVQNKQLEFNFEKKEEKNDRRTTQILQPQSYSYENLSRLVADAFVAIEPKRPELSEIRRPRHNFKPQLGILSPLPERYGRIAR